MNTVRILYFFDILCIWAYVSQIRLEELKTTFGDQVEIEYHFIPIFGDARRKLESRWHDRGGLPAYNAHVQSVAARFDHLQIHPQLWEKTVPVSSTAVHLFLSAVKLLEDKKLVAQMGHGGVLERTIEALREAFFRDLRDIADRQIQFSIAQHLGLPIEVIQKEIDGGEAYAELTRDFELSKEYGITVSPTLIFNEGRQRLNGNVGYRVMEANIRELLHTPPNQLSWC